tara:strand:+ start:67 stop:993 length:927 start_codon:yes stop_codon:yes gene_type:complete
MEQNRLLICAGDPVIDVYQVGEYSKKKDRFIVESQINVAGGALNTWNNLINLLPDELVAFANITDIPSFNLRSATDQLYTIYRSFEDGKKIFETCNVPSAERESFYSKHNKYCWHRKTTHEVINNIYRDQFAKQYLEKVGLVISEYNKGAANGYKLGYHDKSYLADFDFVIVDSRYRTIDPSLLGTSECKIWHATGEEYDIAFSSLFDYTIHTNGPDPVRVLKKRKLLEVLNVPNTPVVDTCGAGDTFTAAISAFLLQDNNKINNNTIIRASLFAIDCCQEVIQKPFTSIVTTRNWTAGERNVCDKPG